MDAQGAKQLLKIAFVYQSKVITAVDALTDYPSCPNVKHLTNHQYNYRLRVGQYRVCFNADDTIKMVSIQEVKKRDKRTY